MSNAIKHIIESTKNRASGFLGYFITDMESNDTVPHQFERWAARQPDQVMLKWKDRQWTYAEGNRLVNRHADAYRQLGLAKGDVIAFMMENRPEFYWHILALGKLGVTVSLINTNLADEPLAHAIKVCEPKRIVIGSEVWDRFRTIQSQLGPLASTALVDNDPEFPAGTGLPSFADLVKKGSEENPPTTAQVRLKDLWAYIYTSGTTGLPKPAVVKHYRFYRAGRVFGGLAMGLAPGDTIYVCLPLYHGNGLIIASTSSLSNGATIGLARKFSSSHFWDDVRRFNANAFVYIGELCRYLTNVPPNPRDKDHPLKVMAGNGLRKDVWEVFQQRFGVKKIKEFYAATEGNAESMNLLGRKVGSCGILIRTRMALARWDDDAQDFVRDKKGFMIRCSAGEPGVLLGKIKEGNEFPGYKDKKATEGKILRDVFEKGDAWFNTGDMLKRDFLHYLYFVDRMGDTYRWRGENVSTFEVQEQIHTWDHLADANVYGVHIHGTEGRAGMAALVMQEGRSFDPAGFQQHVESKLPVYARPLFVRITPALDMTQTFKLKKTDLMKEGFDPAKIGDPLYFFHPTEKAYKPLTPEWHGEIMAGRLRL